MATATGDIVLDFKALLDETPYTPSGWTDTEGTGQILGGDLRPAASGVRYKAVYTDATASEDIVRITAEMGFNSGGSTDSVSLRLFTADEQNGYFVGLSSNAAFYRVLTAGTVSGTDNPNTSGFSPGTNFSLEYQKSTGRVEIFKDGTSIFSTTNTTHDAADLTLAIALEPEAGSTSGGVASLSGTGFASAFVGLPAFTLKKDGSALGNLTGVKVQVTATGELDGAALHSVNDATTTDGVLAAIDLSATTASVGDPVTVSILTADNDGITFDATVGSAT